MPRTLTASDRSSLIRLASELPVGDAKRKAILAGLSKASRARFQVTEAQRIKQGRAISVRGFLYAEPGLPEKEIGENYQDVLLRGLNEWALENSSLELDVEPEFDIIPHAGAFAGAKEQSRPGVYDVMFIVTNPDDFYPSEG